MVAHSICGFDSIFSVYSASFLDNAATKSIVTNSTKEDIFSHFIKNIFEESSKKKHSNHLDERSRILHEVYTVNYKSNIEEYEHSTEINCDIALGSLFEKLMKADNFKMSSVTEIKKCLECNYEIEDHLPLVPLRISMKTNLNMKCLEKYIIYNDQHANYCRECGTQLNASRTYGNVLAFDVEPFQYDNQTQISTIQSKIVINDQAYEMFAVIQFVPENRHFIAHVKRNNEIWETLDDLKSRQTYTNVTSKTIHVFMIFYKKKQINLKCIYYYIHYTIYTSKVVRNALNLK